MKSHLAHHLHLVSQTRVLIIGLHTMIATNSNLLTSCTVAIKCQQGTSIPFLISGLLLLQHMVRIVAQQGKRYRVEWSQPEEAPERTWELMSKLDSRAEYVELVLAWRAQQEQQEQ